MKKYYNHVLVLIFIFGFLIRLKAAFIDSRAMWEDECSLALNIVESGFLQLFGPLNYFQSAPPFFLILTKLMVNIFGEYETVFRLMSFISGALSLWVFYLLAKEFLVKKHSVLIASFLFSINYYLIYYSQEFKQYSSDVLLVMLLILLFNKIDLSKLSYPKVLGLGMILACTMFFSLPCAFVIGAFVLYSLKNIDKEKALKLFVMILPILATGPFYYYFTLLPSKEFMVKNFSYMWLSGFMEPTFSSFWKILRMNLYYFFWPNRALSLCACILIFGAFFTIFQKQKSKVGALMLLTFLCSVIASVAHIFVFKERASLYLIPIILLLLVKVFDLISLETLRGKAVSAVVILLTLNCFCEYDYDYFKQLFKKNAFEKTNYRAKGALKFLKEHYNNANDTLVYNSDQRGDFVYYEKYLDFKPKNKKTFGISRNVDLAPDEKKCLSYMNGLPKGENYWFFWSQESRNDIFIETAKKWAEEKKAKGAKVLFEDSLYNVYMLNIKL